MEGLIDRQKAINKIVFGIDDKAYFGDADIDWKVIDFLNSLPSVTPKEKTGKWITEDMFGGDETYYRCSECNELFWIESGTPKDNEYNFCPNCGARMEVSE